jgi:uncharacterized membrane protein
MEKNISKLLKGVGGMKSDVTNRQIVIMLYLTLTTYTIISIPKVMAQSAGTGAWLPILAMSVIFSLFVVSGHIFYNRHWFKRHLLFMGKRSI